MKENREAKEIRKKMELELELMVASQIAGRSEDIDKHNVKYKELMERYIYVVGNQNKQGG